ncbi:MAG: hypothetical protein ABNH53_05270 [Henriciella sp.]|jgi:hypothetical protein
MEMFILLGLWTWGIALAALVLAFVSYKSILGFMSTIIVLSLIAGLIVIPNPDLGSGIAIILLGPFSLPVHLIMILKSNSWYVVVFFFVPSILISLTATHFLKIGFGTIGTLATTIVASGIFFLSFGAYFEFEVHRAAKEIPGRILCLGYNKAPGLSAEYGVPYALARTDEATYIYSFRERGFVEAEHNLAPKFLCHPLAQ